LAATAEHDERMPGVTHLQLLELMSSPEGDQPTKQKLTTRRALSSQRCLYQHHRPQADIGGIEIPQRSSLVPYQGVLSFQSVVNRRKFITLLGGTVASSASWPVAAGAQPAGERTQRIGVLTTTNPSAQSHIDAFVQALRALGWIEGRNVRIDIRWDDEGAPRAETLAAELVALEPDAILSVFTRNLVALQHATRSVPIVFMQVSDPVAQGFVASLSRPGGNLTGFTNFEFSIGGKSARASRVSGTVRPSVFAVLRLMTSSYLVGA
jgi:ABC transporter substrate binding protein